MEGQYEDVEVATELEEWAERYGEGSDVEAGTPKTQEAFTEWVSKQAPGSCFGGDSEGAKVVRLIEEQVSGRPEEDGVAERD
jgi:hypothetical protein